MRVEKYTSSIGKVLKQRNFGYIVASVLLLSNLMLVFQLATREEHWILIPQHDVGRRMGVSSYDFDDDYIIQWVNGLLIHLLTVNPSTVDQRIHDTLLIASKSHDGLKKYLYSRAKKIKDSRISTAFYPKDFEVDRENRTVKVSGTFTSFLGRNNRPVVGEKTLVVTWKRAATGVILLEKLEDERSE